MYKARSAEYIRIYESIVIEFFLRLKIHEICTFQALIQTKFRKQFIVSKVKSETLAIQLRSGKPVYCVRPRITVDLSESTVLKID